jgi:hypothetical protein
MLKQGENNMTDIISKIDNRYPPKFDKAIGDIERRKSLTDADINATLQNIFGKIDTGKLSPEMSYRWNSLKARIQ